MIKTGVVTDANNENEDELPSESGKGLGKTEDEKTEDAI